MNKKVKKVIKKQLTPITAFFGILFLVIGVIAGFFVYKTLNAPGETIIELKGEKVVYIDKGQLYNEDGYQFVIDGVDYNEYVVVTDNINYFEEGTYLITYQLQTDGHEIILTRVVNVLGGVSDGQN